MDAAALAKFADRPAGEIALDALRLLTKAASLGDYLYNVRDAELEGWDGPRVKAWSDGCQLAEMALKKATQ